MPASSQKAGCQMPPNPLRLPAHPPIEMCHTAHCHLMLHCCAEVVQGWTSQRCLHKPRVVGGARRHCEMYYDFCKMCCSLEGGRIESFRP